MSLTKWKQTFSRDGCAFKGGEVSVYLAGTTLAARVFDANQRLKDTVPQLETDGAGYVEFSIDTDDYSSGQLFDVFCASGNCIYQDPIELKSLMILQDTEGGRAFKQIFAQSTEPDIEENNCKEGDLWFDTDDGNHPYYCNGTAWVDIQDSSIAAVAADLSDIEEQLDDKVSVYVQEATPSWSDANSNHIDDCWYVPSEKKWYKYDGLEWIESDDSIYSIAALADGKTTIHYSATAPASALGVDGDYCVVEDGSDSDYYKKIAGSWVRIGGFTDGADVTVDNSGELVANPNFEAGDKSWTKSTGWQISTGSQFLGSYCAKHYGAQGDGIMRGVYRPAAEGERFLAGIWVKADAIADGEYECRIQFRDSAGTWLDYEQVVVTTSDTLTTSYQFFQKVATAPADTAEVFIWMIRFDSSSVGAIYVDNVSLVRIPKNSDIDSLETTNGPAEAGADVTGDNTANNTTYVEDSQTRAGELFYVYGDQRVLNSGNIYFYDASNVQVGSIYTDSGEFYFKGAAGT